MDAIIRKSSCPAYCAHQLIDKLAWALEDVRNIRAGAYVKNERKFKALSEFRRRLAE